MLPGMSGMMLAESSAGGGGTFAVEISTTEVTKTGSTRAGAKTLTTVPVIVTASGGAGGYTYAWARLSGDVEIAATTPAAASTTFSATLDPDEYKEALFECTVTDAAAQVIKKQVTVKMTLVFTDPWDGGSL